MNLPFTSFNLSHLNEVNWFEGFRRLKVLLQVVVFLGLSYFSFKYWMEDPFYTKELTYDESITLSEEDKKADEAYKQALDKIGLKKPQKKPIGIRISTDYLGPLVKYDFPINTTDAHIVKVLRKAKGAEFGQVFWPWLGWSFLAVFVIEINFRIIVWLFQGFRKPK